MYNLRKMAESRRWKWGYDPSLSASHSRGDVLWGYEILCRFGKIYPYSSTCLGVSVEGHYYISSRLRRMGLRSIQGYEVFALSLDQLDDVAEIVKPRRKRPGNLANLSRVDPRQPAETPANQKQVPTP